MPVPAGLQCLQCSHSTCLLDSDYDRIRRAPAPSITAATTAAKQYTGSNTALRRRPALNRCRMLPARAAAADKLQGKEMLSTKLNQRNLTMAAPANQEPSGINCSVCTAAANTSHNTEPTNSFRVYQHCLSPLNPNQLLPYHCCMLLHAALVQRKRSPAAQPAVHALCAAANCVATDWSGVLLLSRGSSSHCA